MFAIQANLSEIREQRRRSSWGFALQRARDAQTYTGLYFARLKGAPLTSQEEVLCRNNQVARNQSISGFYVLKQSKRKCNQLILCKMLTIVNLGWLYMTVSTIS